MRKIFLCAALAFALLNSPAFGAALNNNKNNNNAEWVWNVLIVPPDDGWETERGRSIKAALKWEEDEIAQSGRGVAGHDVK
nr:hypothetical protein [Synergistaceae bacterium]